jgi:hypothetical protein
MREQELRAIVREAVQRHLAAGPVAAPAPVCAEHPSLALFVLPRGDDAGGPCVIEPAVACCHCEYCRSRGF